MFRDFNVSKVKILYVILHEFYKNYYDMINVSSNHPDPTCNITSSVELTRRPMILGCGKIKSNRSVSQLTLVQVNHL